MARAAQPVVSASARASRHRVICKGARVPDGWVIVSECHTPACEGEGENGWVVKRPADRELVCAVSPVPEGFAVVRGTHAGGCPGDGDNAFVIERLRPDGG